MRKPTRRSSLVKKGSGGRTTAVLLAKQELVLGHGGGVDAFDRLPDDLVIAVLAGVAACAAGPADLAAAALTCRRFRELAAHPAVLSRASAAAVSLRAGRWSEAAHQFLRRCAAAGSLHACYFLGMVTSATATSSVVCTAMLLGPRRPLFADAASSYHHQVRFYCLGSRATGAALLARAASGGHAAALYALAVLQFNGSGGGKADKDPRAGVTLCARAAWLGHVPALRELGHCLQDGYGARRDAAAGRHLLLHAAARELVAISSARCRRGGRRAEDGDDAASRFMVEWWALSAAKKSAAATGEGDGGNDAAELRLCSQAPCGRRETRRHEFRRCSACGSASYCSRACQALDWKRAHRGQCGAAAARWLAAGDAY
ncbi:F-box protein At5g50450 isoform X1 [Setaria viridis]|uniref:F-box protein At5g50450 isoform X1 n=1 Tax=Setaria viridis TaxID=4556 RepID=UPI0014939038|nr:F-box protein At1g67340-like isoform X1 [Setaria viridis]